MCIDGIIGEDYRAGDDTKFQKIRQMWNSPIIALGNSRSASAYGQKLVVNIIYEVID